MSRGNKILHSYYSKTLNGLVRFTNDNNIPRNDIVSILTVGEGADKLYALLYYYGVTEG